MHDYVDDRINEKFLELDDQIAPRLVSSGKAIDTKIDSCNERLKESVKDHVKVFLASASTAI